MISNEKKLFTKKRGAINTIELVNLDSLVAIVSDETILKKVVLI